MNKIKLLFPVLAIAVSTVFAWASRPKQGCTLVQQYYYSGSSYVPAGTMGRDYMCISGAGTCTYFAAGNTYEPCQSGVYTPLHVRSHKK